VFIPVNAWQFGCKINKGELEDINSTSRQPISTSQSLADHVSLTLQLAMDVTAMVTLPNN